MGVIITLLIVAVIIGALLGGKTFGGTVKRGCGFLVVLVLLAATGGAYILWKNYSERIRENQEVISIGDNSAYFIVTDTCPTYVKPNIESHVYGSLEAEKEIFVETIDKFNYFYEISDETGKRVFVRKECLKRK